MRPGASRPSAPPEGRRCPAGPGRGHWRTYDAADGFPGSDVTAILQDRSGFLWLGSSDGLVRFDGQTFTNFTTDDGLTSNAVRTLCEDRDGNLWVGTRDSGVSRFDGREFTSFTREDGLVDACVYAIVEDRDGRYWFGTWGGVSCFDGRTFTNYTTEDGLVGDWVTAIVEDRDGDLWFGTWSGVSRFDGREFVSFTTADGLEKDEVWAVYQDAEGCLWFGTVGCAYRYDGERFTCFTVEDGLAAYWVRAIYQNRDGIFWFGSPGGLNRYDPHTWTTFTTEDGLPHLNVSPGCQDPNGALWLTSGGIICRFDGRAWVTYALDENPAGVLFYKMVRDRKGHLWVTTGSEGVCRFDGHSWMMFTVEDGLAHDVVNALFEDRDGRIWFGANGGACGFDGTTWTTLTTEDGLAHDEVWVILQDRNGCFWFGTATGLSRWDGHQFVNSTREDGLSDNWVLSGIEDRDGFFWFGTTGGVSRCDPLALSDAEKPLFARFTTRDGLGSNNTWTLFQDASGHLWFGGSGRGVSRYDGCVFQLLNRRDGLAGNMVHSIFQDTEGRMWFGTDHGLTRYHPSDASPPEAYIHMVVADRRYRDLSDLELPVTAGLVSFEFSARCFKTRPESMVYRYRLRELEEDWRTTHARQVEYEQLPEGNYTFELQAVDRDLRYSEPVAVSLTVTADPRLEGLTQVLRDGSAPHAFIGRSPALQRVRQQLSEVAPTDLTVLVLGETGTGKGLAARALHELSLRRRNPFIQVNCGAIPDSLIESELFGHERGAFTGAVARKLGKFELAEGGTLFLDEIGDLPLEGQRRLLQVLQERTFQRVGGQQTLRADVRVVAATNRELSGAIRERTFREDLYYRLEQFAVELPPLRQRRDDIPLLAEHFARRFAQHLSRPVPTIAPEALKWMEEYAWPGNVRELEHAVQRAVLLCRGEAIVRTDVAFQASGPQRQLDAPAGNRVADLLELVEQNAHGDDQDLLEQAEELLIRAALERAGGNQRQAARLLGVPRKRLERRLKKYRNDEQDYSFSSVDFGKERCHGREA